MVFGKKKEEEKGRIDLNPDAKMNEIVAELQRIQQYLGAMLEGQQQMFSGLEQIYEEVKKKEGGFKKK